MKIRIVLPPDLRAWVIEKAAVRLVEYAPRLGVEISVGDTLDPSADVNHWMSYAFANTEQPTPSTMLITHPDDPFKVRSIRGTLEKYVDIGICMSSETVAQLVAAGSPRDQLCYVLFGHDAVVRPRKIVIGITTRLYADGRKRESFLLRLAKDVDLSAFSFRIFGSGWEAVVEQLRSLGVQVELDPSSADYRADYERIVDSVPSFDYYLYTGMDEGSLGTLDAMAGGVGTIVTDQGFHKDLAEALTYRFVEYQEMLEIFERIRSVRERRIDTAREYTWEEYARRHVLIWNLLVAGKHGEISARLSNLTGEFAQSRVASLEFKLRSLHPKRILSALAHVPLLQPAVDWARRKRRRR